MTRRLPAACVALVLVGLCAAVATDWLSPAAPPAPPAAATDEDARISAALAALGSPHPAVRDRGVDALVEVGPPALFRLCPFIQRRLADADERAWRAGCRAEDEIARRYADDTRLDDYYESLPPLRPPRRVFVLPGGVELEFARIPAGSFVQGCRRPGVGMPMDADAGRTYAPLRKVTLTRPFWIMRDEVSQEQFRAVTGRNPSRLTGPRRPVESVNWHQAVAFCRRLGKLLAPDEFDLPTEAQWERACRAGTTARHAFGNRPLTKGEIAAGLAGRPENRYGLRHLHDGVFEWCRDVFAAYSPAAAVDPAGPPAGAYRTVRSNYEYCSAPEVNAAHRIGWPPEIVHPGIGLRVICRAR